MESRTIRTRRIETKLYFISILEVVPLTTETIIGHTCTDHKEFRIDSRKMLEEKPKYGISNNRDSENRDCTIFHFHS